MTFEEALYRLEELSETIRDEETTLDEAVKCYEEGIRCYQICKEMLNETEQKIEVYAK